MPEKKIQGVTYRCEKVGASVGLPLLLRTMKVLGPVTGALARISGKDDDQDAISLMAQMVGQIDDEAAISLVRDLVELCTVEGRPAVFGVNPQDIGETLELALWVAEVQFRDFLGGSGALAPVSRAAGPVSGNRKSAR
mgnify:CR=1 FL=1